MLVTWWLTFLNLIIDKDAMLSEWSELSTKQKQEWSEKFTTLSLLNASLTVVEIY